MSYSSFKIDPLGKDNFDTWKIQVEALLIKNDAWKYVVGSCAKPNEPTNKVLEWESEDAKAKSDLILLIAPAELKQIKNCKTSKEVWDKLHNIYQSKGPARKAMLLKGLILHKMKNGDDIRDHIRKFFDIVDKINEMDLEIIDDLHYKLSEDELTGFADADWGANIDDRRSYTGYIFKLADAAISWDSRKQRTVAMSSTEAEYMSLSEATKEAIHLRRFLTEIMGQQNSTILYNDNQGAGLLSKNPIFHNRTKHMDIRHHFVRDNVIAGTINIEYISTNEMPADFLTKGLSSPKHNKCISKEGLVNILN